MLLQKVLFCLSFFYNSAPLNKKASFSFQHEYIEQGEVRGIGPIHTELRRILIPF
jgi:hypothetical protein